MFSKLTKMSFIGLAFILVANITFAQTSVSAKIRKSNLYAGIEVGSKGVKMSIIQMKKNATTTGAFTPIKDSSINSDFISFTNATFTATLKAVVDLYKTAASDYNIPSAKIFTVFSSGVKGQAIKENKMSLLKKLSDSLSIIIKEPMRNFPAVDAMEEAKLSHLGIVPEDRRYNTFLIDIGSGNTKGGYFKNGNTKELKLFTLTWGTKSIANAIEKRTGEDKSIENFRKQMPRVLAGEPENEIIYAVNESGAYNMNDFFAFSGGIAWSAATLMYPELIDNSVVPVSYKDLLAFNEKLGLKFAEVQPTYLAKTIGENSPEKELFLIEANRVHKVFDQKSLLAGTSLILKIMRQFEGTKDKKQFYFVKNGQVGWITAYVNQQLNN
jgi:hypothetical protein